MPEPGGQRLQEEKPGAGLGPGQAHVDGAHVDQAVPAVVGDHLAGQPQPVAAGQGEETVLQLLFQSVEGALGRPLEELVGQVPVGNPGLAGLRDQPA